MKRTLFASIVPLAFGAMAMFAPLAMASTGAAMETGFTVDVAKTGIGIYAPVASVDFVLTASAIDETAENLGYDVTQPSGPAPGAHETNSGWSATNPDYGKGAPSVGAYEMSTGWSSHDPGTAPAGGGGETH